MNSFTISQRGILLCYADALSGRVVRALRNKLKFIKLRRQQAEN